MKNHQTLACGLLSSLLITACDSGLDVKSTLGTTQTSDSMNLRMPKSLQSSDDSTAPPSDTTSENPSVTQSENGSASDTEDNRESVRETMGEVSEVAGVLDAATTGASTQALYLGADLIYERVEFAEEILDDIDDMWDAIMAYCTSFSANETCEIPGNTLVDEDGEIIDEAAIVYQPNPDSDYAHSISRAVESEGSEFEQIQWNDDRSRISMSYNGDWVEAEGAAEHKSQLIYTEADDGIRVSLRDEFVMGSSSYTDLQQLHALNDDLNGIEIITEFNWREGDDTGKWQSHAVANDQGGKLGTTASFANDPVIWHTRETFDENGDIASSEYCEQTDGIDCSDSANWQKAELEFASAVELDIEDADYDLQEAYLQACEEMDVESNDCGFSESEMVIIDGAYDLFENTDDVIVYLCIETGEDELVCRSEGEDNDTTSQFNIAPDNVMEAGIGFGGEQAETAAMTECADCSDNDLIEILLANPELELGDLEDFNVEGIDLGDLDPDNFEVDNGMAIELFNLAEIIEAEFECDTHEQPNSGMVQPGFDEIGSDENTVDGSTTCIDADEEEHDDDKEQEDTEEDEENQTEASE